MRRLFIRAARWVTVAVVVVTADRHAAAVEFEGVHFPGQVKAGDVALELRCVGLLRYKLLFRAYAAALYVAVDAAHHDARADVPKRLDVSYFWSIAGSDFGKAGDEILSRNVDATTFAALRQRLDRINGWFRDVKPGDRY